MPFDGSGNYSPPSAPVFPAISGSVISSSYYNQVINDVATALGNCLTRDGQGKPSAGIDWNAKDLTNIDNLGVTGDATIGGTLTVTGGLVSGTEVNGTFEATQFQVDATSNWTITAGNPYFTFDTGDYIAYDRTSNSHNFAVGGVGIASIDAAGFDVSGAVTVTGAATVGSLMLDANAYFQLSGGNPVLNLDNNDYLYYDRTGNAFNFAIGAGTQLSIGAGTLVTGGTFQANTFYHGDTSYYSKMLTATQALINFDANDFMLYDRTANKLVFNIGGVEQLAFNSSTITKTGRNLAQDAMSRTSCYLYDSTSAPSGGDNGDFWFQYV